MSEETAYDVLIVGAGISGLNAAYYLNNGSRGLKYAILEGRSSIGGTWDLFRYPGIRCDSDIFTFCFSWSPWSGDRPRVGASEILQYMTRSAKMAGIDNHILFHHNVTSASWDSEESMWTLNVDADEEKPSVFKTRFLVLGTGYYDYHKPQEYFIPGLDTFKGTVVEPQFWPEDLTYANKKVAIVGSGATTVTLLPTMAQEAAHVTMIQRSPTYVVSLPNKTSKWDRLASWLLPRRAAAWVRRMYHMFLGRLFVEYSFKSPAKVRDMLLKHSARRLPSSIPVDPHFTPRYNPWEQRICVCPDGDFYKTLRAGTASVVTGEIEQATETAITMKSGENIDADIIVAATGLKLCFAGGIRISVDGERLDPSEKFVWKGCMIEDVPNLGFIVGYVNASWTLAADANCTILSRVFSKYVRKNQSVTPRLEKCAGDMKVVPAFNLSSTYTQRAKDIFPKGGQGQWAYKANYLADIWDASWGNIAAGLEVNPQPRALL